MKIQEEGQGQIFKHPFLEKLTRAHAAIPITMQFTIAAGLLIYSYFFATIAAQWIAVYFGGGFLFWTLFEYLAHRWVFHMSTETQLKRKIQYTFHGVHHEFPRDKYRIVMPPVPGFLLAALLVFVFRMIWGPEGFSFAAGFLAGYASYSLIHYSIHSRIPPKNFIGKLWMHHSLHHYKDDTLGFGVSSPFWDHIFNTVPKKPR